MAITNPTDAACAVISSVRSQAIDELFSIYDRLEAARRTVQLLKGAAASVALPIIPNLPAIIDLNADVYDAIRLSCPALNLPHVDVGTLANVPGIAQIEALRSGYQNAVQNLLNKLEASPLGLIDQLQAEIDVKIAAALKALGPVSSFIDCVCNSADALTDPENTERAKSIYDELTKKPSLIDDQLSGKMHSFSETKESLTKLVAF